MKGALVTGSAGFVGRHLVPKLEAAGYEVTGVDPRAGTLPFPQWLSPCQSACEPFDVVVHLAANILDVDARSKQGVDGFGDIALDLAVCKYVEAHPPREAFIAMSSCAVDYPEDPYSWVKLTLEKLCARLHTQGVPVKILRPFSGYGADQADSYPFPAILQRAVGKEDPLTVWGGPQVRDWIHIEDLTSAIVFAINNFPNGVPVEIGTGIGTSFYDLAEMMAEAVGYKPDIAGIMTKKTSSLRRVARTALASSLGFVPKISLAEGIADAVAKVSATVEQEALTR